MAGSRDKSEGALQLEILAACSRNRRKSYRPELSWLFSQCSASEGGLFEPYSGKPPASLLEKQTYRQWKSMLEFQQVSNPRRLRRKTIDLQPITQSSSSSYALAEIDVSVLQHLQCFCEAFFLGTSVRSVDQLDLSQVKKLTTRIHKDTQREQVLVHDILHHLRSRRITGARCIVGLTLVDLYPGPRENFVLGHASLTTGCAVVSFGRHFSSQTIASGKVVGSAEQMKHLWVLVRVVTHELCHTFGLKHCYYCLCAMNESSTIAQAARQPLFLCPVCLRKLHKVLKFSLVERYQALLLQCRKLHQLVLESEGDGKEGSPTYLHEVDQSDSRTGMVDSSPLPETDQSDSSEATNMLSWETTCVAEDHNPTASSHMHTGRDCELQQSECFLQAAGWLQRAITNLNQFMG